jgi:lipoyl(octanoyl) transferase
MAGVIVRNLGLVDYESCYRQMLDFTASRTAETPDEVWLLQHPPVFTQGQAGKAEHLLMPGDIPVIQSDRGGQVTYHGPGQLVVYLLLDIKRLGMGPRLLVTLIENAIIATLAHWDVASAAKPDAPGVYVNGRKIASLGLRIRNGKTFHGLALNVDMNMEPFLRINPCGYAGLEMTQVCREVATPVSFDQVADELHKQLLSRLQPMDGEQG